MDDVMAIQSRLTPTLTAGLYWLFDTEQPDGAIIHHLGIHLPVINNRRYNFTPEGAYRRPVVVVDVADVEYVNRGFERVPANPLEPGELEALSALLETLGASVVRTWNGKGVTGSIGLERPAHPTLLAAVNRYQAGCPVHPRESVFCTCGWYQAGRSRLILPEGAF